MLLEGCIEFENQIPVDSECLGKEYPIVIAGFNALLITPLMFQGFNDSNSSRKLGPLHSPDRGFVQYRDDFDWGSVYSSPRGNSTIRACKIIFDVIQELDFEEIANKIALELPKWRNLLIDNVSLALQQDYRGVRRAKTSKSYGLGEFGLFSNNKGINKRFIPKGFERQGIIITLEETLGFDKAGLQEQLDNTSKGITPLLPFYFLFDAERAKFEGNYRKSILDSATAVEVCFSFLISKLLPYDKTLNNYIASKHNSLRLKRNLLKALNVSIPLNENDYIQGLDAIRNKVIHAGHSPDIKTASTAYKIAKETLYILLPKTT